MGKNLCYDPDTVDYHLPAISEDHIFMKVLQYLSNYFNNAGHINLVIQIGRDVDAFCLFLIPFMLKGHQGAIVASFPSLC